MTKYQFSTLFSQAWYKAIKPENIVSGFRKAGICPFSSESIPSPSIPSISQSESIDSSQSSSKSTWSQEKVELFTRRFENGYDIYTDKEYVAWLHENHSGSVPLDLDVSSPSMENQDEEEMDLLHYARSDPYAPFNLPSPMDEIDNRSIENDLSFFGGSSIVTAFYLADDFGIPPTSTPSLSATVTDSSHVAAIESSLLFTMGM